MTKPVLILIAAACAIALLILAAMGGQYERDHGPAHWPNSPESRP